MIELTTRIEHIILDKSGIVFCQVFDGVDMDLVDAKKTWLLDTFRNKV